MGSGDKCEFCGNTPLSATAREKMNLEIQQYQSMAEHYKAELAAVKKEIIRKNEVGERVIDEKRGLLIEVENLQKEIEIRSESEKIWIKNYTRMQNKVDKYRQIPIAERLPKMFTNVLVYGVVEKQNICPQIWEARRFTGWSTGWPGCVEGKEAPWYWLTPNDSLVKDVTYWIEKP